MKGSSKNNDQQRIEEAQRILAEAKKIQRNLVRQTKITAGTPKAEIGCPAGYSRTTVIFNKDQHQAVKNLSYWQRRPLYHVVEDALEAYLSKHPESKKPAPAIHRLYNVPERGKQ